MEKLFAISKRCVQILCVENRIARIRKVGNMWLIPENAEKLKYAKYKQSHDK